MEFEQVRDIIVETLGCEAEDVKPEASLTEDLGADSLAFVELVIALEDATGIHLTVSAEDFIGGVRAVIRSRNILIDNSFKTQLRGEYDKFLFLGGDGNA